MEPRGGLLYERTFALSLSHLSLAFQIVIGFLFEIVVVSIESRLSLYSLVSPHTTKVTPMILFALNP